MRGKTIRSVPFVLVAVAVAIAAAVASSSVGAPNARADRWRPSWTVLRNNTPRSPRAASSYYIRTLSSERHATMGCSLGRAMRRGEAPRDALVVMHFGRPMRKHGSFGASIYADFGPTWRIRRAGQAFARGFSECSRNVIGAHLRLALGTSNYGPGVTFWHGRAWAMMVNTANDWAAERDLDARVEFAGGNDIEPGWSHPGPAKAWVRGYTRAHEWPFYNFGGAAGCPPYGDCQGRWDMEDVWFVSSGTDAAIPLPEIYSESGAAAEQWYLLSLWSVHNKGRPMAIAGVMSQHQACKDTPDPCIGTAVHPYQSWKMLYHELHKDPRTRPSVEDLRYVTDIGWQDTHHHR
jgi:hypothetical protein